MSRTRFPTMLPALLALEDGSVFAGSSFGAAGETFGEAVFNTGMAGYQEILTDPSYARQIVVMTSPHQGNYGVNASDPESSRIQVAGFAVREAARRPSSWRSEGPLEGGLVDSGVVAVEGIDTRRLARRIREHGAMRAAISTLDVDPASLIARVRAIPGMEGADLARTVSVNEPYAAATVAGPPSNDLGTIFRVAAYDFGLKRNILRRLAATGIETTVFPAWTPAATIDAGGYDGVFLSNGPGDPAATSYGIDAVKGLIDKVPIFGICLGHQLLALALGGRTYKMKYGHRGVNQPVKNLRTGIVEITSHNHGFAVDPMAWDLPNGPDGEGVAASVGFGFGKAAGTAAPDPPTVTTDYGLAELTHWNLNDLTLEGLRCIDVPAFSVQYHPEAAPGPHDSRYLFDAFRELMANA